MKQVLREKTARISDGDVKEMCEIKVGGWGRVLSGWEGKHTSKLPGFTHRKGVDPQDSARGVVSPIYRPRIYLPIGAKTCTQRGDDYVVRWFRVNSVFEPANGSGKTDSSVERLWIGDVPEDPRDTSNVIIVRIMTDSFGGNQGWAPGMDGGSAWAVGKGV